MSRVSFDCALTLSPPDGLDLWDSSVGAPVRSLALAGIEFAEPIDSQHLICSIAEKSQIVILNYRTGQVKRKFALGEKLRCLCLSSDSYYCAGGTASGRVFLWNFYTGELLIVWNAHYKAVNQLKFAEHDGYLLSGGEDSVIHAWSVGQLVKRKLSVNEDQDTNQGGFDVSSAQLFSLSDHSLPITAMLVHSTGLLFTSSLDKSVKVYDLAQRTLIANFTLPAPILCIAVDSMLSECFCGSQDGNIYCVSVHSISTRSTSASVDPSAASVPFAPASSSSLLGSNFSTLSGHFMSVSSLALNFDGTALLSGSLDGSLKHWNVATRVCMKTMKKHGRKSFTRVIPLTDNGIMQVPLADSRSVQPGYPIFRRHVTPQGEVDKQHIVLRLQPNRNEAKKRKISILGDPLNGESYESIEAERCQRSALAIQALRDWNSRNRSSAASLAALPVEAANDEEASITISKGQLAALKAEAAEWKSVAQRLLLAVKGQNEEERESSQKEA